MKQVCIALLVFIGFSMFSQPTCTGITLLTDNNHYSVTGNNHDSTFVKHIQIDLSDTSNISKLSYTLSNLSTGELVQKDYDFKTISSNQDLTISTNCKRDKKSIKISLGYFKYRAMQYKINIKLYDKNNNLLSNS